jgi:hypothetical protein
MAMPPPGFENIPPPVGGVSHKLSYEGAFWAYATVNADGASASFCCAMRKDAWSYLTRVSVSLEAARKVAFTVYANGSNAPSAASRIVRMTDELRLFDLKGRERARICRDLRLSGRRLQLRCWDESGAELSGQELLIV